MGRKASRARRTTGAAELADQGVRYLERQERTALGRIGAGQSIPEAVKASRWAPELAEDLGCSEAEAYRFVETVQSQLAQAVGPLRDRRPRVAAARMVYGHLIEMARTRAGVPGNVPGTGDGKHMVYILHDHDDRLLYVGITDRGPVRLAEHYRHKPWFCEVARVEFERYDSRAESEAREKYLIQRRAPLHNIQHNMGRQIA